MRRIALIAVLVAGLTPATAHAHAQLESANPKRGAVVEWQPRLVEFKFDEAVEGNFGAVRVFDRDARRVDRGDTFHPRGDAKRIATRLAPGLADGSYTATYRVLSGDGHVVAGGSVFSIGKAGATGKTVDQLLENSRSGPVTSTAFAITRALGYLALALAAGAMLMALYLWPARGRDVDDEVLARSRPLLLAAGLLGTMSAVGAIVLQAAQAVATSAFAALRPSTLGEIVATRFGIVTTIAVLCWLAVLVAAVLLPRAEALAILVPLGFLCCVPALSGHASAGNTLVLLPANVLHVAAMACWLGGLAALLLAIPRGRRPDAAIARFSTVALVAVVVLLITGLLQAVIEIRQPELVLTTAYGRAVLIKLGLLSALIGLGTVNRAKGVRRTTLKLEVAVIVVVLAVSGALAGYSPARSAASGPFSASERIGSTRMDLTVDPAAAGVNTVHIYLTDPGTGAQADTAKEVDVAAALPSKGIGPLREEAHKSGPGHYTIAGLPLGVSGRWTLTVTVRVSEFDQYAQKVEVPVR